MHQGLQAVVAVDCMQPESLARAPLKSCWAAAAVSQKVGCWLLGHAASPPELEMHGGILSNCISSDRHICGHRWAQAPMREWHRGIRASRGCPLPPCSDLGCG